MSAYENMLEQFPDESFLIANGLNDAIVGVELLTMRVVYNAEEVVQILQRDRDMTEEDAVEFYEFNIAGAWMGEKTPIFMHPL
jgi:hypothetical protein